MRRRPSLSVLLLLMLTLFASACSKQPAASSTATSAGSSTAPAPAKKIYTVGILIPNLPDPFHQSVYYGMYSKAKELGNVKVIMFDAGGFDQVSKQVSQMDDLLQSGVDAVILNPTNTASMVPAVDKATGQGKPVILYGSVVNTKYTSFVAADQKQLGEDQAKYMVEALKGTGKIAAIPGPAGVSWAVDREKAFRDYLAANSKIEIVTEKWTPSTRQDGLNTMQDILQANPNLDGVYTGTDFLANGAAEAIKAAGKGGKLVLTTAVMSPDTQGQINEGLIAMTAAQQSVAIGAQTMQTAIDVLSGKSVQPTYPIQDVYVTKDNIAKVDKSTINAPAGWKPPATLNP